MLQIYDFLYGSSAQFPHSITGLMTGKFTHHHCHILHSHNHPTHEYSRENISQNYPFTATTLCILVNTPSTRQQPRSLPPPPPPPPRGTRLSSQNYAISNWSMHVTWRGTSHYASRLYEGITRHARFIYACGLHGGPLSTDWAYREIDTS